MKTLFLAIPVTLSLAACDTTGAGLAGGAALGAALDDDNRARGAVIGAAAGATAGALVERYNNGTCLYRDRTTGETYRADCPA